MFDKDNIPGSSLQIEVPDIVARIAGIAIFTSVFSMELRKSNSKSPPGSRKFLRLLLSIKEYLEDNLKIFITGSYFFSIFIFNRIT